MSLRTMMPTRYQRTPFGQVTLQSYWKHDRYYLRATGELMALRWLFPEDQDFEMVGQLARHAFAPFPRPITVERELRKVCVAWQQRWNVRLQDHEVTHLSASEAPTAAPVIATIGQAFEHGFEQRKGHLATSTQERDKYYLKLWRPLLGENTLLWSLRQETIFAGRAVIAKATSASTANCATALLKTYIRWAHQKNLMSDACLRGLKPLKETARRRDSREWWRSEEVDLAVRCASEEESPSNSVLLVAVGCLLGLRVEEIIMLRWEDLDLDAKHPTTGLLRPVCHLTPHAGWKPKDGEARDIPIHEQLQVLLLRYRQSSGYLLMPQRPSRRARKPSAAWAYRFDPRRTWNRLGERIRAAGGRSITMAGMRHTFASNNLLAGVSDWLVAKWLGHADTRMVNRHYGHVTSYHEAINTVRYESRAL